MHRNLLRSTSIHTNFKNLFIERVRERPFAGKRGSVAKTIAGRQLNEELVSPVFIFSWWIRPGARLWRCGSAGSIRFFICGKILGLNNLKGQRLSLTLSSRVCSMYSLCVSGSKMRNNTRGTGSLCRGRSPQGQWRREEGVPETRQTRTLPRWPPFFSWNLPTNVFSISQSSARWSGYQSMNLWWDTSRPNHCRRH